MAIPDGWLQSTQFAVLSLKLPAEIRDSPGFFGELGNVTYKDMHKHIGIGQMHLPSACTKYIHALPSAYTSWTFQWKKPRDQQCQKNCNMLTCPAWILSHVGTLLSHVGTLLSHFCWGDTPLPSSSGSTSTRVCYITPLLGRYPDSNVRYSCRPGSFSLQFRLGGPPAKAGHSEAN